MIFLLTASIKNTSRRVCWVSLQPDGSVSIGLSDRAFVSPDFRAKHFVWSAFNRVTLHYAVPSEENSLKSIRNPHLTFHPPNWFHLTANDGKRLFEAITDLKIMLDQSNSIPWIRFVSKQITKLPPAGIPLKPQLTTILSIPLNDDKCSVGIGIDFMRTASGDEIPNTLFDQFIPWQDYFLRIHAVELAPQVATLSWFHQK